MSVNFSNQSFATTKVLECLDLKSEAAADPFFYEFSIVKNINLDKVEIKFSTALKNLTPIRGVVTIELAIDNLRWLLKIYPQGRGNGGRMSAYIGLNSGAHALDIPANICIGNENQHSVTFKKNQYWGFSQLYHQYRPQGMIGFTSTADCFTCKIIVDVKYIKLCSEQGNIESLRHRDVTDVLFTQSPDVTFIGSDWQLKAHRTILENRCSYFESMFNNDTVEAQTNEIKIPDVDEATMKAMLEFIYWGRPSNINHLSRSLCIAADKYGLQQLKELCENKLVAEISLSNVIETFLFADLHSCQRLESACMRVIHLNIKQVRNSEKWKILNNQSQIVLFKLLDYLASVL